MINKSDMNTSCLIYNDLRIKLKLNPPDVSDDV